MEATRTLVTGRRLVDVRAGGAIDNAGLIVEGDRIAAVGPVNELRRVSHNSVVELPEATLIPGLMDLHVHLMAHNIRTCTNFRAATFETTPQIQMFEALAHAQMALEMGFTTLRNLGWIGYTGLLVEEMVAVREAIDRRLVSGPRILVAAWAAVTGSHLDQVLPPAAVRPPGTTGDSPNELRKIVRSGIMAGADLIKTNASNGTSPERSVVNVNRSMTEEEIVAVVDTAHSLGKRVAVHCFTPETQLMALRAGADTLEHSVFTSPEAIEALIASDAILVPTLTKRADETIATGSEAGRSALFTERMRSIQADTWATFQQLHAAGVKMALGTDTSVEPRAGSSAIELEEYVRLGMSTVDALRTATINAAEAVGLEGDLGALEQGRIADLVAVRGNPLSDISVLRHRENIELVMRSGEVLIDRRPVNPRTSMRDPDLGLPRKVA